MLLPGGFGNHRRAADIGTVEQHHRGAITAQPRDAVALAAWFAASFDATEMLVIGADLPADASVPLRAVAVDQGRL